MFSGTELKKLAFVKTKGRGRNHTIGKLLFSYCPGSSQGTRRLFYITSCHCHRWGEGSLLWGEGVPSSGLSVERAMG